MKEMTGDPREYEAFVREIDESKYITQRENMPRGIIPKRRGMSLAKSLAMEGVFTFHNFAPRVLASLVASSTAACTSKVVTVTATAHGIPATSFDGYSFYYPGSTSLAAGWYSGFARTSADAMIFSAPSAADFASESVNSDAAMTSEITYESVTLPANTLVVGDKIISSLYRASNNAASNKVVKLKIGNNAIATNATASTTAMIGAVDMMAFVDSATSIIGYSVGGGSMGSTILKPTVNIATSLTISITGQISVAGQYIALISSNIRIE